MNPLLSGAKSKPHESRKWLRRALVALPLLCLLVFGTLNLVSRATGANADASLVPIKGEVPGLVKTSTLVGAADTNQSISLSVGLQLRNSDALKAYADNTIQSRTTQKPQHLTQAQIASAFAPLASSQQSVIDYLQSYGFTVTNTGKLRLLIDFKGTIGDAENAFHIQINNYRTQKGQSFFAPANNPSVPANLAGLIQNIAGLNNSIHYTHPPIPAPKSLSAKSISANTTCTASGYDFYTPTQIASAYNLASFHSANFQGEGQTVALYELDNYSAGDIKAYTSCYGGGQVPINTIAVDGGAGQPSSGQDEVELDMEMILSAAPHLAALDVYEAPLNSTKYPDPYLDLWNKIINDDLASVISTSWGSCEAGAGQADIQEENNLFTIAAAQGQTVFAAAGDSGTNGCLSQEDPNADSLAVDDPASQPYVTGVGGTRLTLNGNTYESENVWNEWYNPHGNGGAGGGGISSQWGMPSWQQGPGVINSNYSATPCGTAAVNGHCREVPDVSLNADPYTPYLFYCSCNGGWWGVGGTSVGAPLWAAFMALTNEKTLHDGGFNIGFINPYLYQIGQSVNGTSYSADFHDIIAGPQNDKGMDDLSNDTLQGGAGPYDATANYDMATGLGSYNAWNLGNDLEKLANAQNGSRQAPANTKWYFAEGSVGGGFSEYLTILNPSTTKANVTVQYLFSNSPAVTKTYVAPANARFTLMVNKELGILSNGGHQSISAIVTSDQAIVVERPMYFDWYGLKAGSDVLGATDATNTTFYFAQGEQGQIGSAHYSEFITMLNPSSTATVSVTAQYINGGKVVGSDTRSILPLHRGTISPSYKGEAAIELTATGGGIVAERPTYVSGTVSGLSGSFSGAASTVGATTPGNDWLFAEGHTSPTFQEDLVLANFGAAAMTATINLEYTNGTVQTVQCQVNAQTQYYFSVNSPSANTGCTVTTPDKNPTNDVSAEVTSSTTSLVAERVMYFKYGSIPGITDVVGKAGSSSQTVYSFAEGYTGGQFTEYLTLQNPTDKKEVVALTLFADNTIIEKEITLAPTSRTTIGINKIINPLAGAYPAPGAQNVSMVIQALGGGKVIAERPMYFNYGGKLGGTDIIGYTEN